MHQCPRFVDGLALYDVGYDLSELSSEWQHLCIKLIMAWLLGCPERTWNLIVLSTIVVPEIFPSLKDDEVNCLHDFVGLDLVNPSEHKLNGSVLWID